MIAVLPSPPRVAAQGGAAAVGGVVRDLHGTPQMGALVELLAPDASVVTQTYTDDHGRYVLTALSPGRYQLRASGAFLLPSLRPNLLLNPGMRALANLTMTAMVDVGTWFPVQRRSADEPSDDWRWTLHAAANRPLLRLDDGDVLTSAVTEQRSAPAYRMQVAASAEVGEFAESGTHQVVSVQRADGHGAFETLRADLGQPSPSLQGSYPTSVELRAGLERKSALGGETRLVAGYTSHPELAAGSEGGLQALTLASGETLALGDAVLIDAGTLLSAERLVQSRVSAAPFLRVVVTPATGMAIMYRYASTHALQSSEDLDRIEVAPEILSDGRARPVSLRNAHQEVAFAHHAANDTETLTVFQDHFSTTGLAGIGLTNGTDLAIAPIVADEASDTFRLAAKGYTARGVGVAWTHQVSPGLSTSFTVALGSAMKTGAAPLDLRTLGSTLQTRLAPAVEGTVQGSITRLGTRYRVQYRWQPGTTLDTVNAFNNAANQAYLSCSLKQRLWSGHRLHGLDAVLEATNLLEEGYQPMVGPDGQTLILAQVPRSMQAGLSFSF